MKIVRNHVLRRFRKAEGTCECCLRTKVKCVPHHLWSRGCGGAYRVDAAINLISVCAFCHNTAHATVHQGRYYLVPIVACVRGSTPR